jgi:hypothetical protein
MTVSGWIAVQSTMVQKNQGLAPAPASDRGDGVRKRDKGTVGL